jgi:lipid II:glycine glycyltransferase (peptidoglycan interpeptide bridge formation enzyme)
MFQVFARTKGHQPELWAAVDQNSKILTLLLPVHITLMDGLLRRLTTRSVVYGSVLCQDNVAGQKALYLLLNTYAKNIASQSLYTELRNLHNVTNLQPVLRDCGYVYEDHLNYLIDLERPLEDIMQSIGHRTRKQIRREVKKSRVIIKEVNQRDQLIEWYKVLQETYTVAKVPLADATLFEAAYDILYPRGMVKFLTAWIEDTCVACSAELLFKDVIYGWYGGVNRAFTAYVPNEMLIWHILQWGVENGYRVYDFGGAGEPTKEYGVRNFKAKFGGNLVCYGRNVFVQAPGLLRLSKQAYHLLRGWL